VLTFLRGTARYRPWPFHCGRTPDYLVQHASRERRYERLPASTWDAVLRCIRNPADVARLADSAERRLLYRCAISLYRHAADAGDLFAAWRLAQLPAGRGGPDGLRARADPGDQRPAAGLARLLGGRGDLDEMRGWADGGWLAELLTLRGDLDGAVQELRVQADGGDRLAALRLGDLLAVRGDLDGAGQVLRVRADAGDQAAAALLADLLAKHGDLDELRALVDGGNQAAAERLPDLMTEQGRGKDAVRLRRFGLNPDGSIASAWFLGGTPAVDF
jgi:hypothetical protein